ncbi:unnamed protein product [Ostreobium quekettii]|uniref:Uncharacterized protein n=1 Tax=Ostreobium quekettii TaxID=121088 RepID=A0A8S1J351_9CHLO|nr:unnamed protein product [Ostreobium quekettii]
MGSPNGSLAKRSCEEIERLMEHSSKLQEELAKGHSIHEQERQVADRLRRSLRDAQLEAEKHKQEAVQRCSAAWASVAARREEENMQLREELNQVVSRKEELEAQLRQLQLGTKSHGSDAEVASLQAQLHATSSELAELKNSISEQLKQVHLEAESDAQAAIMEANAMAAEYNRQRLEVVNAKDALEREYVKKLEDAKAPPTRPLSEEVSTQTDHLLPTVAVASASREMQTDEVFLENAQQKRSEGGTDTTPCPCTSEDASTQTEACQVTTSTPLDQQQSGTEPETPTTKMADSHGLQQPPGAPGPTADGSLGPGCADIGFRPEHDALSQGDTVQYSPSDDEPLRASPEPQATGEGDSLAGSQKEGPCSSPRRSFHCEECGLVKGTQAAPHTWRWEDCAHPDDLPLTRVSSAHQNQPMDAADTDENAFDIQSPSTCLDHSHSSLSYSAGKQLGYPSIFHGHKNIGGGPLQDLTNTPLYACHQESQPSPRPNVGASLDCPSPGASVGKPAWRPRFADRNNRRRSSTGSIGSWRRPIGHQETSRHGSEGNDEAVVLQDSGLGNVTSEDFGHGDGSPMGAEEDRDGRENRQPESCFNSGRTRGAAHTLAPVCHSHRHENDSVCHKERRPLQEFVRMSGCSFSFSTPMGESARPNVENRRAEAARHKPHSHRDESDMNSVRGAQKEARQPSSSEDRKSRHLLHGSDSGGRLGESPIRRSRENTPAVRRGGSSPTIPETSREPYSPMDSMVAPVNAAKYDADKQASTGLAFEAPSGLRSWQRSSLACTLPASEMSAHKSSANPEPELHNSTARDKGWASRGPFRRMARGNPQQYRGSHRPMAAKAADDGMEALNMSEYHKQRSWMQEQASRRHAMKAVLHESNAKQLQSHIRQGAAALRQSMEQLREMDRSDSICGSSRSTRTSGCKRALNTVLHLRDSIVSSISLVSKQSTLNDRYSPTAMRGL